MSLRCPTLSLASRATAVKKALKAVLAHRAGATYPFTHYVGLLTALCADAGIVTPPSLDDADLLTPMAWR
jgi:hypothetical protein